MATDAVLVVGLIAACGGKGWARVCPGDEPLEPPDDGDGVNLPPVEVAFAPRRCAVPLLSEAERLFGLLGLKLEPREFR